MSVSVVRQVVFSVRVLTMVLVVGSGAEVVTITVTFETLWEDDTLGRGRIVEREVPMVVLETRGMVVLDTRGMVVIFGRMEGGMMKGMETVDEDKTVEVVGNGVTVRVDRLVVESVALTVV